MTELTFSRAIRRGGGSTAPLERGARRGALQRLRPGVYVDMASWQQLPEARRHLLAVYAVHDAYRTPPVFSHLSAAAIWGVPVVGVWAPEVHVSFEGGGGMTRRAVRCHRARFAEGDVVEKDGLLVTSPQRTAFDLASTEGLARGAIALDHVFAKCGVDRGGIVDRIARERPFPGVRRIDAALQAATGLAESPLETLSMARFVQHGLPIPDQQVEFRGATGSLYRVDFHWRQGDVIGEADGAAKYETREDLLREKSREDDLRELAHGFARWGWADAWAGTPMLERLARAGVPRR